MQDVIIIGAGAAGLMAAKCLAEHEVSVTVVEARDRIGGRIFTVENASRTFPVELGAEFIHGRRNEVWEIVRDARLLTHEVPDRHWVCTDEHLTEARGFWDRLEQVMAGIENSESERSVLDWLNSRRKLSSNLRQLTLNFVEGFHAAPASQMSLQALARSNAASARDSGERAFRVERGYSEMIRRLFVGAGSHGAQVQLNAAVKSIRWEPGMVEVEANTPNGPRVWNAGRVLVTVPLGVLKNRGIIFDPELTDKTDALGGLEMGQVVKLTLQFRSRFWPVENFGFIHADDEWLPTWWADERGWVLTGWAGGPRAQWLAQESEDSIRAEALRALSHIFKMPETHLSDLLIGASRHDWSNDPFAGGAYSFTRAGGIQSPDRLAESISDTLFFAGEATDSSGEQGTVHAALRSGKRAASEIFAALPLTHESRSSHNAGVSPVR